MADRLSRLFSTARLVRDLRKSRNAWRNKAYAAMDAERELAAVNVVLRARLDVMEKRPGVLAVNVRLAHELDQAEAMLEQERELHRTAVAVLRRYMDVYGDLPAVGEVA